MTFCAMPFIEYTAAVAADPYAANVVSLMRFEGGSIVDDIGDNIWTLTGATLSSTTPVTGSGSLLTTAQTQYAKTTTNPTRFQFGTGDFTVEWSAALGTQTAGYPVPMEFVNDDGAYNFADTTWQFYFTPGTPVLSWWKDATIDMGNNVVNAFDGNVHRYAVSRVSGVIYMYYDGVQIATQADTTNYAGGNTLIIGNAGDYASGALGKYDEVRITKGVGRYSGASYTVSTDPFPSTGWVGEQSTGWLLPTGIITDVFSGTVDGTRPISSIQTADGTYAFKSGGGSGNEDPAVGANFTISIPSGKAPVGYEVRVTGYRTGTSTQYVTLSRGYASGYGTRQSKTLTMTGSNATLTLGGPTDAWGLTYTRAQIMAEFCVYTRVDYSTTYGQYIDLIELKVHYA